MYYLSYYVVYNWLQMLLYFSWTTSENSSTYYASVFSTVIE